MTLEQLRIFVAVAAREHVTRAAADLHLTQSAVSAAIAALEARYATKLFDRVGRGIILTEAGRLFLVEARAVLARAEGAEKILIDLADLTRGSLKIAASQTIGNYWLPPLLHRFRCAHPGVALALAIDNTAGVARRVHEGEVDIGLVEGEVEDARLSVRAVAEDELALVAAPDHPWVKSGPPPGWRGARWVLREPGSGTRAMLEAALAAMGATIAAADVALELPSNEAVCAAVAAGAGVTLMSRLAVTCAVRAGALALAPAVLPRRRFYALHHRDYSMTRAQQAFLALIETAGAAPYQLR